MRQHTLRQASLFGTLLAVAWSAADVHGAIIPVTNPGFEALTGTGEHFSSDGKLLPGHRSKSGTPSATPSVYFTPDPVPGWALVPTGSEAGTVNPPASLAPSGVPGGSHAAYVAGSTLTQTVLANIEASTRYTLTVEVGRWATLTGAFDYEIRLLTTGPGGSYLLAEDHTTATPAPGAFRTATLTWESGTSITAGTALLVQLTSRSNPVAYDNVMVTAAPIGSEPSVPEPGAIGLIALGGTGLLGRRRRN